MVHDDLVVHLGDGRTLGYAECGDPSGMPVFLFPGFPGTQPDARFLEQPSQAVHLHLIIPDRPGLGLSDPQQNRSIAGWADDIPQLASILHADRFAVLGISEGGPYALACAARLQTRVSGIGIVAGPGPSHRRALPRITDLPRLVRRTMSALQENPAAWKARVAARQCTADKSILEQPAFEGSLQHEAAMFFHQGTEGPVQEHLLLTHDWGLSPVDIQAPVQLWYGREDTVTPPAMAEELAGFLPHSLTRWFPEQGHLLLFPQAQKILAQLTSR